jgi:hypothetical protein
MAGRATDDVLLEARDLAGREGPVEVVGNELDEFFAGHGILAQGAIRIRLRKPASVTHSVSLDAPRDLARDRRAVPPSPF